MLNIAICDDLPEQLEWIAELTNEYIEKQQINAQVYTFTHPDEILKKAETSQFHIYILDIIMPMMTGVQLGIELRRLDREAQLIYATTAPEFALESFAANPIGYLVKPIEENELYKLLDLAVQKSGIPEEQTFVVKTKEGLRVLNVASIVCCERLGNMVRFTITNGEIIVSRSIRGTFTEYIAPLMTNGQFLQSHVSFLINMNRVERLSDKKFIMRGGSVVPVATKLLAGVRKIYLDYVFARGKI